MGGFGGFGGTGLGGPGGFAQFGASGSYFMMPAFDVVLRMADRNLKQRLIVGDLTYRITALPEGKKALHLYNVPGGRFDFSNIGFNQYRCWYWYYDTNGDRDDCLAANPDIVRLPSDIPLEPLNWQDLNTPAQQWVRRWFTAYCKETLGRIWGKYSGNLKTPDSELTLDYASLLGEAKDERAKLEEELKIRLERLSPVKQMEKEAELARLDDDGGGMEAEDLPLALMRHATSSGCSTTLVEWLTTPGMTRLPAGSGCSLNTFQSCSWRTLPASSE